MGEGRREADRRRVALQEAGVGQHDIGHRLLELREIQLEREDEVELLEEVLRHRLGVAHGHDGVGAEVDHDVGLVGDLEALQHLEPAGARDGEGVVDGSRSETYHADPAAWEVSDPAWDRACDRKPRSWPPAGRPDTGRGSGTACRFPRSRCRPPRPGRRPRRRCRPPRPCG